MGGGCARSFVCNYLLHSKHTLPPKEWEKLSNMYPFAKTAAQQCVARAALLTEREEGEKREEAYHCRHCCLIGVYTDGVESISRISRICLISFNSRINTAVQQGGVMYQWLSAGFERRGREAARANTTNTAAAW